MEVVVVTTLEERAARLAGAERASAAAEEFEPLAAAELEFDEPIEGEPDDVPVHVAWRRVMREVRVITKDRQVVPDKDGRGPRYKFRGVEDVVKAFSTAIRRHGIVVGPERVEPTYSAAGPKMHQCTIVVTWWVQGPRGDYIDRPIQSAGEAMDYQDKATSKAQSIALRTLMTTLGFVPTEDPEPEAESAQMERGDPTPRPADYLAEITNPLTSRERLRQIYTELGQYRMRESLMEHEGQRVELGRLLLGVVESRWPSKPAPAPRPVLPAHDPHPAGEWADGCPGCMAESVAIDQEAAS